MKAVVREDYGRYAGDDLDKLKNENFDGEFFGITTVLHKGDVWNVQERQGDIGDERIDKVNRHLAKITTIVVKDEVKLILGKETFDYLFKMEE